MSVRAMPSVGLAVTTIGRPALAALLQSAARSTVPPAAVAIANQSRARLNIDPAEYEFPVTILPSAGGASAGRNDAVDALPEHIDVLAFPNDDSVYPTSTLQAIAQRFAGADAPAAVACTFNNGSTWARGLPPAGSELDRYLVWRAIEWAMFVDRAVFTDHGGFRTDLGTGAPSPWQSGEGTDLLLRMLPGGHRIVSAPDIEVLGRDRRDLPGHEFVVKHRRYARGTGMVYRTHPYPTHIRLSILFGPWLHVHMFDVSLALSLRIAFARTLGRLEGLTGHLVGAHGSATEPRSSILGNRNRLHGCNDNPSVQAAQCRKV